MNKREILSTVDHTLLSTTATWEQIRRLCDEGIAYQTASVCIPACFVEQAAAYVSGKIKICTVIGFPNGYTTTAAKCFEAADAIRNGAEEIDMVISLGAVKEKRWDAVLKEIQAVKETCGEHVLKVIVETCLLTEEEKIALCDVVSRSGADFIKTSTGFSTSGATREDIALFKSHVANSVRIKAAGGISSFEDAQAFLELGADRLGTSRLVRLMENAE